MESLEPPAEIMMKILESLDQGTLFNVAMCSRSFYQTAFPFLYRHVVFKNSNPTGRRPHFPGIYNFACQVLSDPDVAGLVKSISIEETTLPVVSQSAAAPMVSMNSNVLGALNGVCSDGHKGGINAGKILSWLTSIYESPDSEATFAAVLPYLPHLERLEVVIDPFTTQFSNWVLRLADTPLARLPCAGFKNLKYISNDISLIDLCDRSDPHTAPWVNWKEIAHFFGIAGVQKLEFNMETFRANAQSDLDAKVNEPGLSSIDSLSFRNVPVSFSYTDTFLGPNLHVKELKILWDLQSTPWAGGPSTSGFDFALYPGASELESFTTYYTHTTRNGFYTVSMSSLRCLSKFSNLKDLKIGMGLIFGFVDRMFNKAKGFDYKSLGTYAHRGILQRMLPPNLETLHVIKYTDEVVALLHDNILALMSAKAHGEFMSLESITVTTRMGREDHKDWMYSRGREYLNVKIMNKRFDLTEAGKQVGIKFEWRATPCSHFESTGQPQPSIIAP